jgi:hypothetical protein
MNRRRLCGISSAALVLLVAGACGSAARSARDASTGTTSPPKRLELATTGAGKPSVEGRASALFPVRPTTYELDTPLPDLGPTALVRRMNAHPVGSTDVQRFATALGLQGAPTRTPVGWEVVQGTEATLSFVVTNGVTDVSYSLGVPSAVGGSVGGSGGGVSSGSSGSVTTPVPSPPPVISQPPSPVDVPSADEARTIARELLDRLGVLAGQSWTADVNDSGGVAVACPVGVPCPSGPPEVYARTVTFSLMLDGARVDGVDWSVTIGEHRRIQYLNGQWATPAPLGNYLLRSTAGVFADLRNGKARYTGPQPLTALSDTAASGAPTNATSPALPTVTVHITGVSLGIARWDAYDGGDTIVDLIPTYRFHARVDGGAPYDIVVLALDPGAVTFTNPAPKPEPPTVEPMPAPAPAPDTRPSAVPVPETAVSTPSS